MKKKPFIKDTVRYKVGREIESDTIFLAADAEGNVVGRVPLEEGLRLAEEARLDLVEVSPGVCKINDYKYFLYQIKRKLKDQSKKSQKQLSTKEILLRPRTDEHDYQIKLKRSRDFLILGHKVQIALRFAGREMLHKSEGVSILFRFENDIKDIGRAEPSLPNRENLVIEGRHYSALFVPIKSGTKG